MRQWMCVLAVVVLACESGGQDPTISASPTAPPIVTANLLGPGQVDGCVAGEQFPVTPSPDVEYTIPPSDSCTTTIHAGGGGETRVMKVSFTVPEDLQTGERLDLNFANTGWLCPVPGPVWAPVLRTEDWGFTLEQDGDLAKRSKCTCKLNAQHNACV